MLRFYRGPSVLIQSIWSTTCLTSFCILGNWGMEDYQPTTELIGGPRLFQRVGFQSLHINHYFPVSRTFSVSQWAGFLCVAVTKHLPKSFSWRKVLFGTMSDPCESQPTIANKAMQNDLVHSARNHEAGDHGRHSSPTHKPSLEHWPNPEAPVTTNWPWWPVLSILIVPRKHYQLGNQCSNTVAGGGTSDSYQHWVNASAGSRLHPLQDPFLSIDKEKGDCLGPVYTLSNWSCAPWDFYMLLLICVIRSLWSLGFPEDGLLLPQHQAVPRTWTSISLLSASLLLLLSEINTWHLLRFPLRVLSHTLTYLTCLSYSSNTGRVSQHFIVLSYC